MAYELFITSIQTLEEWEGEDPQEVNCIVLDCLEPASRMVIIGDSRSPDESPKLQLPLCVVCQDKFLIQVTRF